MPINSDKPHLWKADTLESIDFYNEWFLRFAPSAFRRQRRIQTEKVTEAFRLTDSLRATSIALLRENPGILSMLRMTAAPPLARDRLVGLAYTTKNLVSSMEGTEEAAPRIPPRMSATEIDTQLTRIIYVLKELADRDHFTWLDHPDNQPSEEDLRRSASVVADRLCGAAVDPIIRNAQEKRQLTALSNYLDSLGYTEIASSTVDHLLNMSGGTYAFRCNVEVGTEPHRVKMPVDCVLSKKNRSPDEVPILIEAKSAGDATNTNKRRKEEAQKFSQLKQTFGNDIVFVLFLCGYFETGYLGYEASEGIDWVWEHRIKDLLALIDERPDESSPSMIHEKGPAYQPDFLCLEGERFRRQKRIDQSRTSLERNKRGQFSTPFSLATEIVRYSTMLVKAGAAQPIFLEPACGSGVFFSACIGMGLTNFKFKGIEIDAAYSSICEDLFSDYDLELSTADLFEFAETGALHEACQLLVTNPPYVRHHHLSATLKTSLQRRVMSDLGIEVSGLSGLYIYYILLCDRFLSEGGIATWLVPCEFLYTNYGRALRHYLKEKVSLIRLHTFRAEDVQFDDALVSSCVITFEKRVPGKKYSVCLTSGTYQMPSSERVISWNDVSADDKWGFLADDREIAPSGVRLDDLFHITRGLATGNNDFFILTPEAAAQEAIDERFLIPLLPSPRYIDHPVIEGDSRGHPLISPKRCLLSVTLSENEMKTHYPKVNDYLQKGIRQGVAQGYLCKSRKLWYLQENRPPPLFVATYMGRGREGVSPIRFFLNRSAAVVTNAYICLYPRPFLLRYLEAHPEREIELLALLNSITNRNIERAGRSYGGGLQKIEPKELRSLRLTRLPEWLLIRRSQQVDLFDDLHEDQTTTSLRVAQG